MRVVIYVHAIPGARARGRCVRRGERRAQILEHARDWHMVQRSERREQGGQSQACVCVDARDLRASQPK